MKHEEEVEFAKFHEWCDNVRADTQRSIKEAAAEIEQLGADISKATSDAEVLAEEVEDLNKEVGTLEADAKSATAVRNKEKAIFEATHLDFTESIEAIEKAISVLKSRSADVQQSLMQVSRRTLVPEQAKQALESFLALHQNEDSAAPEANAYEFQSGGVIDLLEKLKKKFQDQ